MCIDLMITSHTVIGLVITFLLFSIGSSYQTRAYKTTREHREFKDRLSAESKHDFDNQEPVIYKGKEIKTP